MTDQTNKLKLNNKIGELNQTIAFYFWTMIDSFLINFIPSTIGCNKPNQPILYGPLLLWKAAITNRSIKAKRPTVPSINNIKFSKSKNIEFYISGGKSIYAYYTKVNNK